jgi:hypothetical protein
MRGRYEADMRTTELCEAATLYETSLVERLRLHIPLLKVWPGRMEEDIVCSLDPHDLGQHPPYTALSYIWAPGDFQIQP